MTSIFTIGYEKSSLEDFIATLQKQGVSTLLDVRELPLSRRKGFSKTALRDALADAGINYRHERSLGSPKPIRERLKQDGNYKAFFKHYDEYLTTRWDLLNELAVMGGSVSLMCYERDPKTCHRTSVARELGKIIGVEPTNLWVKGNEAKISALSTASMRFS